MEKIFLISVTALALMLGSAVYAEGAPMQTASALVEQAKTIDGSEVAMTVEMIGDVMNRGDFTWVNGLDSTGAMGLWVPETLAAKIKVLGNGKFKGDIVVLQGEFHRACPEHGGDMDVHVSAMEVITPGYPVAEEIPRAKVMAAVYLTLAGLVVGGVYQKIRLA